jgi:SSS family solute:Na+ symporter
VGGGFSIGLGGLGFTMGLSVLDALLLGAWLSAVFLIPKVSHLGHKYKFFTFPQIFNHFYNPRVAFVRHNFGNRICWFYKFSGFGWSQISIGYNRGLKLYKSLVMGLIAVIYTAIGD